MKLRIHRGCREIGGTCIELTSRGFTLVLDLGMPLMTADGSPFAMPPARDCRSLRDKGILPDIPVLYETESRDAALLLTHAHLDHCGLAGHVKPGVDVYATDGSRRMMDITRIFVPDVKVPDRAIPMPRKVPFQIGPFQVTAFPVPHSAPDAVALLIEADGQRMFYSGDMRGSGPGAEDFESIMANPPADIDALLLEGTCLGSDARGCDSEEKISANLAGLLAEAGNLTAICCSGQNLDRLITCYRAARLAGKTMVIDLYTAFVLKQMQGVYPGIPQADWPGMRVKYWRSHAQTLVRSGHKQFLYQVRESRIDIARIVEAPSEFLVVTRPGSLLRLILHRLRSTSGVNLVWSMWKGYWNQDAPFRAWCEKAGLNPFFWHFGGHASGMELQRLACALNPRVVIPVHTCRPDLYKTIFPRVHRLEDGTELEMHRIRNSITGTVDA